MLDIENLNHNRLLSVDDEVRMVYDPKLTNQENSPSCIAVVAQRICANRLTRRGGYAPPQKNCTAEGSLSPCLHVLEGGSPYPQHHA